MVPTNGTNLYVRVGGHGPAVVLLHGFGDTGDMWAPLAAVLVKDHTVIVPDLRGMGLSDHPDTGYTKKNQAVDIAGVMDAFKVQKADLVTHDIGNMVGYALAAQYPSRITRWAVIDAPLPGIGDWDNIIRSPLLWHFNFRGPDEERLVQGRERIYLDRFWNELSADPKGIDEETRRHYAALYARGRMRCTTRSNSSVRSVRMPSITRRCSLRAARSRCRCSPSAPKNPSARRWRTSCVLSPATSRSA
jgi:pimeloyl-ACP methyl ester carboxylesterase